VKISVDSWTAKPFLVLARPGYGYINKKRWLKAATADFFILSEVKTHSSSGKMGKYLTAKAKAITPKLVRVIVTTNSIHEGK
jgi:hypothetical protein